MGFRFSLKSANTVANLTFGKVMSCYRDIFSSYQSYDEFMYFLKSFGKNIYSGRRVQYFHKIDRIQLAMRELERNEHRFINLFETGNYEYSQIDYDENILEALRQLSDLFSKYKIKSLLLPGLNDDYSNFMMDEGLLEDLVYKPSINPYLILQPQDCPNSPTIFNAFPHFEVALKQADLWPAVLFWTGKTEFVFIPIKDCQDLHNLFKIIRHDKNPIEELKKIAESRISHQQYIFQLSDLHIGDSKVLCGERRLKNLIDRHLKEIQPGEDIKVLITGDAVDSPNAKNQIRYEDFSDFIEYRIGGRPVRVLGNHDINNNGIAITRRNQQIVNLNTDFPRIEILKESKVILLLFNSNTNGSFAQGEIGQQQMAEMGNILDRIENIESYNLIAVLHHHIVPIPEPDEYERRLFGKQIEKLLQLTDANIFIQWLQLRNVKVVLHGHKHVPFITESNGINIIACGSSTGQVKLKEKGKTYLSYNILKLNEHGVTCTQFVEDILGAGEKNLRTKVINF